MNNEKKNNESRKKKILWIVGAILVLGILGSFVEADDVEQVNENKEKEEEVKKPEKPSKKDEKEENKFDKDALEKDFDDIIKNSNGIIREIRPNPHTGSYNQMEVIIDGIIWEVSTETEKINFAETIWNTIAGIIYKHNALERGDTINLTILDEHGYELAKQSLMSGKFKIKR